MNSVGEVLLAAERFGDRVAVEGPDGCWTFTQLSERVRRLAGALLAAGLEPGDRVLELQPNSCAAVESDLALAVAGLVRVPLNPRLRPVDWTAIATDSGARGLLYSAAIDDAASFAGEHHDVIRVVTGNGPGSERAAITRVAQPFDIRPVDPDTLVALHYSSGTTGKPKGAQRTHRNRLSSMVAMERFVLPAEIRSSDTFVHAGPIIHTSGLFMLAFLAAGARQLLLDHATAEDILVAFDEQSGTHTALVPTVLDRVAQAAQNRGRGLPSARMIAYAGAPMPADQVRRVMHHLSPNLVQYYGLVEAMPPLSVLSIDDHAAGLADSPELLNSAGRLCPHIDVELRDSDGVALADDTPEPGELQVRGDVVMPGYWNAVNRTDLGKAIDASGWLATGDVVRREGDRIWLVDRRSDMLISGGYNIYPGEIEQVATQLPAVELAVAVGVPDPTWGQRIVLAYHCGPDAADAAEVLAHCAALLPGYKRPREAVRIDDFPLTALGKLDRRATLAMIAGLDKQKG